MMIHCTPGYDVRAQGFKRFSSDLQAKGSNPSLLRALIRPWPLVCTAPLIEYLSVEFLGSIFVSPLATLAFEICVVGDTGLKTEWVSCELR